MLLGKCIKCGREAEIRLRSPLVKFCREHYIEYVERKVRRVLEKYHMVKKNDLVLICVSGGKDSTSLLHIMHKLSRDMKFSIMGLTIMLSHEEFFKKAVNTAIENYRELGVDYVLVDPLKEYDINLDRLIEARIRRPLCSACGIIKRYIMNSVAIEVKATKVATGHNLDDLMKFLFVNFVSGDIEQLIRTAPISITERRGFVTKIKPLAECSEREMIEYAKAKGLKFIRAACPYKKLGMGDDALEFLNSLDERYPGLKINMFRIYMSKIHPALRSFYRIEEVSLRRCKICNMPSLGEICSFCKLRILVRESRA
ncbi:MAG: TIGR00269 family protein [Thermoprotei archaeon]|nr:MAG: TIGR00269 family protein [Thermoprotei archaeon]RLF25682.1 MAG: TIGR00269 family protein [Thermoprotei archaeon]